MKWVYSIKVPLRPIHGLLYPVQCKYSLLLKKLPALLAMCAGPVFGQNSLTEAEILQIETDLGITLSEQQIQDLASVVKPQTAATWRSEADARIETHRKAALTVEVVDSAGNPVPGAAVRMALTKHNFKFGGVVTVMDLTDARNNLAAAGSTTDDWKRVTKALFNSLGLDNGFKTKLVNQHQYIPDFMTWAAANNLDVRGHLLLWPGTGDVATMDASGVVAGVNYGNHLSNAGTSDYASYDVLGALETYKASARTQADKDALEAEVDAEVQEWVSRWDVYEWDVINETLSNTLLQEILGYDQMAEWFKIAEAHKVSADAKLFINEFQLASANFEAGSNYESRRDTYFSRIDQVMADGGAIDGIGFQSRFKFLTDYDPATVYARLEEFATRYPDLDLVGTEFEIKDNYQYQMDDLVEAYDEMTRAKLTEEILHVYFSHDQMTGMNAWDFMNPTPDGTSNAYTRSLCYYGDGAGGVDGPVVKLNGLVWYYLHRIRYHSDVTETTSTAGTVILGGYKGDYDLIVNYRGKDYASTVNLLADGTQQVVLNDVSLPLTEVTLEYWPFDDATGTPLQDTLNAVGSAVFDGEVASGQTNGTGGLVVTQHPSVTAEWQGDFILAQPMVFGARDTGKYELECKISSANFTSGDANGASIGFGMTDTTADSEIFMVRLNKALNGLALSTYIDSTYTLLHSFSGQFTISEPLRIRSEVDLDAGTARVYLTIGNEAEAFKGQVALSVNATTWDSVIYAAQNNQTDWGMSDSAVVDYFKVRKLEMDRFHLWAERVDWSGESLKSPLDNPDGDGLVNLLEFALGGNPVVKDDESLLPRVVNWSGAPHLEMTLGVDSLDLTYSIQHSVNLVDWDSLSSSTVHGQAGAIIRIPLIDDNLGQRFSRLKVYEN